MRSIACRLSRRNLYPFKTRSGSNRFVGGYRCEEVCPGLFAGSDHCFDLAFGNRPLGYRPQVGLTALPGVTRSDAGWDSASVCADGRK